MPHGIMLMEDTTNAALRRRPREYESEREDEAERKYCDKALDERLEGTCPTSDPVAGLQSLIAGPMVSPQRTLS